MVGAVLNIAIAEAGKTGDFAIFFQSELCMKRANHWRSLLDSG